MATSNKTLKFLQGLAQTITSAPRQGLSSIAAGVEGVGELGGAGIASLLRKPEQAKAKVSQANSALTRERDFGLLGKSRPFGMDPTTGNPGKDILKGTKDIVGGGLQLGAFAAPVGIGAKAPSMLAALASGASRGALQGSLAAGGQALSEDDNLKEGLIRTGVGAATGGLVGGALSGGQYGTNKIVNLLRQNADEMLDVATAGDPAAMKLKPIGSKVVDAKGFPVAQDGKIPMIGKHDSFPVDGDAVQPRGFMDLKNAPRGEIMNPLGGADDAAKVDPASEATFSVDDAMKKLLKGGHSRARAEEVIQEAMDSSNPEKVLQYWGAKNVKSMLPTDQSLAADYASGAQKLNNTQAWQMQRDTVSRPEFGKQSLAGKLDGVFTDAKKLGVDPMKGSASEYNLPKSMLPTDQSLAKEAGKRGADSGMQVVGDSNLDDFFSGKFDYSGYKHVKDAAQATQWAAGFEKAPSAAAKREAWQFIADHPDALRKLNDWFMKEVNKMARKGLIK